MKLLTECVTYKAKEAPGSKSICRGVVSIEYPTAGLFINTVPCDDLYLATRHNRSFEVCNGTAMLRVNSTARVCYAHSLVLERW